MWSRKTKRVKVRHVISTLKASKKVRRVMLRAGRHNYYKHLKYSSGVKKYFKREEHRVIRRYGNTLVREPEE
jgi:hypothetical protein